MIKNRQNFISEGKFYKGNTHTHTKNSDGQASYEDRIADYRNNGYNFLVLTDHNFYSTYREFDTDNFILFPGTEYHCGPNGDESYLGYHTTCLAIPEENTVPQGPIIWPQNVKIAYQTKYMDDNKNVSIAAHPYWLGMKHEAIMGLMDLGIIGLEVFNSICHFGFGTGDSESYLDYAIQHGKYPLIFASDDYHGPAFSEVRDHFTGYIKVKAKELTHKAIYESIMAGSFFASYDGPDILNFEIKDGKAIVETEPCRQICLRSPKTFGYTKVSFNDDLTRAEFNLNGYEECVRAVVIDKNGHKSWTQILKVENEA